ncbi:hypothetical protein OKW37_000278 [Paraburkholderia sp. MM5482-R2]
MFAEPIRPPLINSTSSQCKQYFANRSRSLFDPYCDKALDGLPSRILAAEYHTVLPDERLLAEELAKMRREWEAQHPEPHDKEEIRD